MAYVCTVCGNSEKHCECSRFCMLCRSDLDVRLCEDGCYYCADCRDACGFSAEQKL